MPLRDTVIQCPVLFLAGSDDSVIQGAGEATLRKMMAARVPQLQIALYPGIGHWLQNEAAEQVNVDLLAFATA